MGKTRKVGIYMEPVVDGWGDDAPKLPVIEFVESILNYHNYKKWNDL
jgi:hypothetical protein